MDNNCQSPCLLYIAPILLNISHIYSHYYHKYLLPIITFLLGRYHFFMLTVFCLAHFFLHPSLHFFPNSHKILFRNFPCFLNFIQHLKFHHYSFFSIGISSSTFPLSRLLILFSAFRLQLFSILKMIELRGKCGLSFI